MSNWAPCVFEAKPGQTPAGGVGVFSEMSETDVPAGGVPALTEYCTPPWEPLALHVVPRCTSSWRAACRRTAGRRWRSRPAA